LLDNEVVWAASGDWSGLRDTANDRLHKIACDWRRHTLTATVMALKSGAMLDDFCLELSLRADLAERDLDHISLE
jgi:hypothetical protein